MLCDPPRDNSSIMAIKSTETTTQPNHDTIEERVDFNPNMRNTCGKIKRMDTGSHHKIDETKWHAPLEKRVSQYQGLRRCPWPRDEPAAEGSASIGSTATPM